MAGHIGGIMTDKIKYWFVYYGIENSKEGCTILGYEEIDFFPLRRAINHLSGQAGARVTVKNFIEVSKETFLEFQEK